MFSYKKFKIGNIAECERVRECWKSLSQWNRPWCSAVPTLPVFTIKVHFTVRLLVSRNAGTS